VIDVVAQVSQETPMAGIHRIADVVSPDTFATSEFPRHMIAGAVVMRPAGRVPTPMRATSVVSQPLAARTRTA
jgi:hypothetical protein